MSMQFNHFALCSLFSVVALAAWYFDVDVLAAYRTTDRFDAEKSMLTLARLWLYHQCTPFRALHVFSVDNDKRSTDGRGPGRGARNAARQLPQHGSSVRAGRAVGSDQDPQGLHVCCLGSSSYATFSVKCGATASSRGWRSSTVGGYATMDLLRCVL